MQAKVLFGSLLVTAAAAASAPRAAHAGDECTPSRLMIVLDKSSSMTGTIGGATKWSIATDALDSVAAGYESSIEMGLMIFPEPNECSPGAVFVEPGKYNRAAMIAELGAPPPAGGNWTPMAQTLEQAAIEPSLTGPGGTPHVVLITDGWQWCSPYDPATRFDAVDAVSSLNAAGITTYVVGFGGGVDALALNTMAVEAGTQRAGCDPAGDTPGSPNPCYYQADDPSELLAALMDVAIEVSSEECDGLDNDCDGEVDEDLSRGCTSACGAGTEVCVDGAWTGCDAPPVETETCDGIDNDCDGTTDPGCDCSAGETRECGDSGNLGACSTGTQTCSADGVWGGCEGAVDPSSESCDGDDNDCDGATDESEDDAGNICGPGFVCVDGGCEPSDPVTPPDDEAGADDEGDAASNCACSATGAGSGDVAGMLLLVLGVAVTLRRRKRR
jgi:MYXO-CTERM domain-containing protein